MEKKITKEAQEIIDKYNKEYPNDPKSAEEYIKRKLKYRHIKRYYYEKNEQERKTVKKSMKYVGQGEYVRKKLHKEFDFKGFSNKKEILEYIQQLERKIYYKLKKYHIEQDPNIDKITLEKYYRQELMYIIEHTSYVFFPLTKKSKIKTLEYISQLLSLLSCNLSKRKFVYENQGEIVRKILKKKFDFRSIVNKKETLEYILKLEKKEYYSLVYFYREKLNKLNPFFIEKKYKSSLLEYFKKSCLKKTHIFDLDGFKYDFDVKSKTPISPLFYIKELYGFYKKNTYKNAGDIIRNKLNIKLNLKKIEDLKIIRNLEKQLHFYYKGSRNFNVKILYEMILTNIIKKSISPFSFFSRKVNSDVYIDNLKENINRQKKFVTGDYRNNCAPVFRPTAYLKEDKSYFDFFWDSNIDCEYKDHWHAIYPNFLYDIEYKLYSWMFDLDLDYDISLSVYFEIKDKLEEDIQKIFSEGKFSKEENHLNFSEKIKTGINIIFLIIWLMMRIFQGLLATIFLKQKDYKQK